MLRIGQVAHKEEVNQREHAFHTHFEYHGYSEHNDTFAQAALRVIHLHAFNRINEYG